MPALRHQVTAITNRYAVANRTRDSVFLSRRAGLLSLGIRGELSRGFGCGRRSTSVHQCQYSPCSCRRSVKVAKFHYRLRQL